MKRIQYLYHSGFLMELEHSILVFDYYAHPKGIMLDLSLLPTDKPIIFFISHAHSDHYTPAVLDWCRQYAQIHAVVSNDVPVTSPHERIFSIGPHQTLDILNMHIRTLRSTDEGVAFLAETEGLTIYHAGDLNWWHWVGEDDQWNRDMDEAYKQEIALLADTTIDYAFLPLDPRLEETYDWGVKYFLDHVTVQHWLPMHFSSNPEYLEKFASPDIFLTTPGQVYGEKTGI